MKYPRLPVGPGFASELPGLDFETFSEAGYLWDPTALKWRAPRGSVKGGLPAVGAARYSEHPSTEILSLAYDLQDGTGEHLWVPGMPAPKRLFDHIAMGLPLEAWNSLFEYFIWTNVCLRRMAWPPLPLEILRDPMAKARAWGLPGGLGDAGAAIKAEVQKQEDGKRLLTKFSRPRNPTKNNPATRIRPVDDPEDASKLYTYNRYDVRSQRAISSRVPDLTPEAHRLWILDQRINTRGVQIDVDAVKACIGVLDECEKRAAQEIPDLTGGRVKTYGQVAELRSWLSDEMGVMLPDLTADTVEYTLRNNANLPAAARRVLEIRNSLGSSSVKKLFAMDRQVCSDGRLRDIYAFHKAGTGRYAGKGPQPQNLPGSGPAVRLCPVCSRWHGAEHDRCLWDGSALGEKRKWCPEAADQAIDRILGGWGADDLERVYGDPIAVIAGCLRGMFIAAPGHELICSDYSSIEAVCLAVLAGEQWRIDVFNSHGKIYEMSASKISGVPFEDFLKHREETGEHHPLRKKLGKVAELASGYQGSVGAWKNFGAEAFFDSDDDILAAVRKWRQDSPNIVNFWYRLEDAARSAILNPGTCFSHRSVTFGVTGDVLYCKLPSGRLMAYQRPRVTNTTNRWGKPTQQISYMRLDSVTRKFLRVETYGGKFAENVTQATAFDFFAAGQLRIDPRAPLVLHTHDEPVSEIPAGAMDVETYEALMVERPAWAEEYPIRAGGGWIGKRYRKD